MIHSRKYSRRLARFLSLFAIAGLTRAALVRGAADVDPAAARFITADTILVATVDTAHADVPAAARWLIAQNASGDVTAVANGAADWLSKFNQAGAMELDLVANLDANGKPSFVGIVPLAPNADSRAIAGLLVSGDPAGPDHRTGPADGPFSNLEAIAVDRAVLFGAPADVDAARQSTHAARPEFTAALADAGSAPIRVAVALPAAFRANPDALVPANLPAAFGGQATDPLIKGLKWISVATSLPPAMSLRLSIQSADPAARDDFSALYATLRALVPTTAPTSAPSGFQAALDGANKSRAPVTNGNSIVITLDADSVDTFLLTPFLNARRESARIASLRNLRQIALAITYFGDKHNGAFPDSLNALADFSDLDKSVLINPADPAHAPGYIYIKPPTDMNHTEPDVILVYEATAAPDGLRAAGFADGHAEQMSKDDFAARMKSQGATTRP